MRNINLLEFMSLDGVIQAPGGPNEDSSGGFQFGGWMPPYTDEAVNLEMQKQMTPSDLLLGRTTFEIFENYWPHHTEYWQSINDVTKYVYSHTRTQSEWQNCVFITSIEDIRKLKQTDGGDIQVYGSSQLAQLLLQNELVDELWLKIFPVTLGPGKRLFGSGTIPAEFTFFDGQITTGGVIIANYKRSGDVKTGSFAD